MATNVTYTPRTEPSPILGLTKVAYTVSEAAALLNVSPATVTLMLRRGVIFGLRIGVSGMRWRIPATALEKWAAAQQREWNATFEE